MLKKALKVILKILLFMVVLTTGIGIAGYLYLGPEWESERLPSPAAIRSVENGEMIGFQSRHNTHAWLGIPYAAPPVGELRWKAPRPPEQWTDRFEALEFGSVCPQPSVVGLPGDQSIKGEEDCLFLNIWAPTFQKEKIPVGSGRLPVMLWIHGGGNGMESGGNPVFNGSALAGQNRVIVLTINYRLGTLGWFRHPALRSENSSPEDNSGNYGTLDIIQALKWAQKNINAFGGDPGNVTIFGQSAGGSNVLSLMASPLAKGLFHRAIVQSGGLNIKSVSSVENYTSEVVNRILVTDGSASDQSAARTLQERMSKEELAAYLHGKSSTDIIAALGSDMLSIFGDGYVLPKDMTTAEIFSDAANFNSVPIILGSNRDEAKFKMVMESDSLERLFGLPFGFKDETAYEENNRYISDRMKARCVDELASLILDAQGNGVFAYRFDADDWRKIWFIDLRKLLGAAHALEAPFVFGNFFKSSRILFEESTVPARDKLSESMMSYWTEFAYSGHPGRGRSVRETAWMPWQNGDKSNLRLMILDTELDRGIRMSSEWITMADIRARYKEFTYSKNPRFTIEYPEGTTSVASILPDEVFAGRTPDSDVFRVHVTEIPREQALDKAAENYAANLESSGILSGLKVTSNVEITLKDGTKAYRSEIQWFYIPSSISLRTQVVSAYKEGKMVYITASTGGDPERIIPIVESLQFD